MNRAERRRNERQNARDARKAQSVVKQLMALTMRGAVQLRAALEKRDPTAAQDHDGMAEWVCTVLFAVIAEGIRARGIVRAEGAQMLARLGLGPIVERLLRDRDLARKSARFNDAIVRAADLEDPSGKALADIARASVEMHAIGVDWIETLVDRAVEKGVV